ncbi:MAG: DNA/RNA nuclease SfsA [Rhodobacteraceae bacterium]|nr:DNA/RNA nuclease SfsA [Paracoccaceae bacterium]
MDFHTPLIRATLLRRYKRFLADVVLEDGREVTTHVANPGSMLGMKDAGMAVWLEPNDDPKRKLNFSWKLAEVGDAMIVVDTAMANKVVGEALRAHAIAPLAAYSDVRAEVKYGENSRIDFLLQGDGIPDCYVEVKSVTLSRQAGLAEFPDSVTKRGAKHLRELSAMVADGHRAVMLYLVQRDDCTRFALAADIDAEYAAEMSAARKIGVEALCFATKPTRTDVNLVEELPIYI